MNQSSKSELDKILEKHFPIARVKAELAGDNDKTPLIEAVINAEVNKVIRRANREIKDLMLKIIDNTGGDAVVASRKWLKQKVEDL